MARAKLSGRYIAVTGRTSASLCPNNIRIEYSPYVCQNKMSGSIFSHCITPFPYLHFSLRFYLHFSLRFFF